MTSRSLVLAAMTAGLSMLTACPMSPLDPPGAGGATTSTSDGGGSAGGSGGSGAAATGGGGAGGTSTGGGGTGGEPIVGDRYNGGLVWNDWTADYAGGSGLPTGVDSAHIDFVRCPACHGWDALGASGGYVRRTATQFRPQPSIGADLSPAFGLFIPFHVEHTWGREWTTFDNDMPDYTQPGSLTAEQVDDVVAYLNVGPKIMDVATLDIVADPVGYTFINANTTAGATLYAARCATCHGGDGTLEMNVSIGPYFTVDGGYSEGFHKIVYGIGPTMSRADSGDLTAIEARDILAYIQANLGTVFPTP